MNWQPITITPGQLKSPLVTAAAVFCALSALLGLAGIVLLFDKEFAALLVQDRIAGGVQSGSSLRAWYLIDTALTVLCFLCPLITVLGLWIAHRVNYVRGLGILSTGCKCLLWGMYAASAAALAYYLFRMVRYIILVLPFNEAPYYIYSLLVTEGLMGVQAWLVFWVLRKFLQDTGDCILSITYTLSSGKLDSAPIPSFPALGLVILGIGQLVLAWDRVFTFTIIPNYVQDTYKILIAEHPGQYLAAATLFTGAIANFLLSAYLRHYNRVCERTRFQANRNKLGS